MNNPLEIKDKTYNYLTAIRPTRTQIRGMYIWAFKCVCGNIIEKPGSLVKNGKYKSCGCKSKKKMENLPNYLKVKLLFVQKKTTRQISNQLGISQYTVWKYIRRYKHNCFVQKHGMSYCEAIG